MTAPADKVAGSSVVPVPLPKGIDLRDYLAASALLGLITGGCTDYSPLELAERAYTYADAMLLERER